MKRLINMIKKHIKSWEVGQIKSKSESMGLKIIL